MRFVCLISVWINPSSYLQALSPLVEYLSSTLSHHTDKSLYTTIFLAQNSCCETALHYLNTVTRHLEQSKEHRRKNSKSTKPSHRNLLSSQLRCSLGFACLDACFSLNLGIFKARHAASEFVNNLFYHPCPCTEPQHTSAVLTGSRVRHRQLPRH